MDRLGQAVDGIEAACAELEAALLGDDLETAGLRDQQLNASIGRLAALLDESSAAECPLETAAARLSLALERHGALMRHLGGERDRTADELRKLRSGRRAATHYLDTAGATAR
jgi:hypothetical protein